jgi:hypothetical protein
MLSFQNCGPATPAATLVTTGGAQTVFPTCKRNYLLIVNCSTDPMMLTITTGSTPSATSGILLSSYGSSYERAEGFVPDGEIKLWCANAGDNFYAVQG